jgi:hypothetical protein
MSERIAADPDVLPSLGLVALYPAG